MLTLAALALSAVASAQIVNPGIHVDAYQVNYAANLNVGDSSVILTNTGQQGAFFGATPTPTQGNICVNVYTFDPQEEEISCCACLVTPNGLNALSAKNDLINNTLTPAVPNSIVVKLVASQPGTTSTGAFTICNPSSPIDALATFPYGAGPSAKGSIAAGMRAWMNTLEPNSTSATYGVVHGAFLPSYLGAAELGALTSVCNFNQTNGTGYGICGSCQTGALSGQKN
ncbi:MAG: hypothetical protein ABSB35_05375 [Bryobacteraceae bacterium]